MYVYNKFNIQQHVFLTFFFFFIIIIMIIIFLWFYFKAIPNVRFTSRYSIIYLFNKKIKGFLNIMICNCGCLIKLNFILIS